MIRFKIKDIKNLMPDISTYSFSDSIKLGKEAFPVGSELYNTYNTSIMEGNFAPDNSLKGFDISSAFTFPPGTINTSGSDTGSESKVSTGPYIWKYQ